MTRWLHRLSGVAFALFVLSCVVYAGLLAPLPAERDWMDPMPPIEHGCYLSGFLVPDRVKCVGIPMADAGGVVLSMPLILSLTAVFMALAGIVGLVSLDMDNLPHIVEALPYMAYLILALAWPVCTLVRRVRHTSAPTR